MIGFFKGDCVLTAVWRNKGQARASLWFSCSSYLLVSNNYSNRTNKKKFTRVAFEKRDTVLVFLASQFKSKCIASFSEVKKNPAVAEKL